MTVHVFLDHGAELAAGTWGIRYDPLVVQADACQTDPNVANAMCNPAAEAGLVRMTVLGLTAAGRSADVPAAWARSRFAAIPRPRPRQMSSLAFEVTNSPTLGEQLPCPDPSCGDHLAEELGLPAALAIRLIGTPPYQFNRVPAWTSPSTSR